MSCGQMLLFSAMERTGSTNKCGRSQARVNLNAWDLESLGKLGDCFRPLENLCYNVYPFQVVTIRFTLMPVHHMSQELRFRNSWLILLTSPPSTSSEITQTSHLLAPKGNLAQGH